MKLIKNTGNDRVDDELRACLVPQSSLDIASPAFSLFAYAEVRALSELSLKRRDDIFCRTHKLSSCFRRDNYDYQRVAEAVL